MAGAATTTPAPSSLGFDVSYPQCGTTLPSGAGFGIVGVNNGYPFSVNPCLVSELQWAKTSLSAQAQFYANTANPGPSANTDWPTSQQTPQVCAGADSTSCAYDYGWNGALNSFQNAVTAETQAGSASPQSDAAAARWWLDVETGNSWESLRTGSAPTSAQQANDAAVIQGELAYLASVGAGFVGIYSTSYQFGQIVGTQGSALQGVPVWLPGYATVTDAQAACANPSFTGGRVTVIQFADSGIDGDYLCGLVSVPATATVAVSQSASFTQALSVTGEAGPVSYLQSAGAPSLLVSSAGVVSATGPLAAGTYVASGTSSSADGLSGTFSFSLVVGQITQVSPLSESVPISTSGTYSAQIVTSGGVGTLSFTQSSGQPALSVSPTGLLSTTGALARGTYKVAGAVSDATGDQGTYAVTLKVGYLSQTSSIRTTISPAVSTGFTSQLSASGGVGPLSFTQSTGQPSLVVSSSGLISTGGALADGSYVVRGLVSDATGDQGSYFFNLLVAPGQITQTSPATITVSATSVATFTSQLTVSGAVGTLAFLQLTGEPSLAVSSSGLVSAGAALALGTYTASGTVSDPSGDKGTFAVSLVVAKPLVVLPVATRVLGHAVIGHTAILTILGQGFFGRPRIVGRPGSTVLVLKDTGTSLTVRVSVPAHDRPGVYSFVIVLANGKICSVHYVQR